MKTNHLWQGRWLNDAEFESALAGLGADIGKTVAQNLDLDVLLKACEEFRKRLLEDEPLRSLLSSELRASGELVPGEDESPVFAEIAAFLSENQLRAKVSRELGSRDPFAIRRIGYDQKVFECWAPLGFLVHVTPGNVFSVAALSVLEGLLTGNMNFVKLSSGASLFTHLFFAEFFKADPTGSIQNFVIVSRLSSRRQDWLSEILSHADGLAAWGGEDAVASLRTLLPSTARLIAWGHRVSFAYVANSELGSSDAPRRLAEQICALDQQACSSPQCIYLETGSRADLESFADRLARELAVVSPRIPGRTPSDAEASEITVVMEKQKIAQAMGHASIRAGQGWRIFVDDRSALLASPLFRSIWIRPLKRERIIETLRPLRGYLQTVGLVAKAAEVPQLSRLFVAAGATRIRPCDGMLQSYAGEPHDGEYALTRYSRRISWEVDESFKGIADFSQLEKAPSAKTSKSAPIMEKADFQKLQVADQDSHLYFKSGGSSGEPKISIFTYADYHRQMRSAADGLFAAGLDPAHDRCMNLFFAGGLYGGFISFFTVLETLGVKQFPMAAHFDWDVVVDSIIRHRVNVLLGMPSYLMQLFHHGQARLAEAKVIQKVFYGGEHFTGAQAAILREKFGVVIIRSAVYGSVDAGPLAYQCEHCTGSVHHLFNDLQSLEIVCMDRDEAVSGNEIGRLVLTSKVRSGQALERYAIGDLGRWVDEPCACGRGDRRFELLGRAGDVFRAAGSYLNYRKWRKIFDEDLKSSEEFQLIIRKLEFADEVEIRSTARLSPERVTAALADSDRDLRELLDEKSLRLKVSTVLPDELVRTPGSGKLVAIIDRRLS